MVVPAAGHRPATVSGITASSKRGAPRREHLACIIANVSSSWEILANSAASRTEIRMLRHRVTPARGATTKVRLTPQM